MKRFLLILFVLILIPARVMVAQENTPNSAAHGAEKEAHEIAHPAEQHGEGEHAPKTYFGVPRWIFLLVNMVLFLGALWYFIRKPIAKGLADRRAQIAQQLAEAKERRVKADQLARDIEERIAKLESEVQVILDRATEEGERQKAEMVAAAQSEAEKILAAARTEVDVRVRLARKELTEYAAQLATENAHTLLQQTMTDEDRKRLFSESVGQIGELKS
jgi:ATP synthase F0 subunit b